MLDLDSYLATMCESHLSEETIKTGSGLLQFCLNLLDVSKDAASESDKVDKRGSSSSYRLGKFKPFRWG